MVFYYLQKQREDSEILIIGFLKKTICVGSYVLSLFALGVIIVLIG